MITLNREKYVEDLRELALSFAKRCIGHTTLPFVLYVTDVKDLDNYILSEDARVFNFEDDACLEEDCPVCKGEALPHAYYERLEIKEVCESPYIYGYIFGATARAEVAGKEGEILIMIYEGEFEPAVLAVILEEGGNLTPLPPLVGEDAIKTSGEVVDCFMGTYTKDLTVH